MQFIFIEAFNIYCSRVVIVPGYTFRNMLQVHQKFGILFLFLIFSPSLANPVYMVIGGDAVLRPATMDVPIKTIEWKHNEDIAADWFGDEFECFGQFKGRCEVNPGTGALTIKRLKLDDSGIYTPEINGRVPYKIELSVISRVPKPFVKTSCNIEMTHCNLTCEGNTAEAGPVVYKWFVDGKHGTYQNYLIITKDTKENSFSCLMKNPVSNETSESITNPFRQELSWLESITVPVVIVLVVIMFFSIFICIIRGRRRKALSGKLQRLLHKMGFRGKGTKREMGPLNQSPNVEDKLIPNIPEMELRNLNNDARKPETNCEPSADEQEADDRDHVD